MASSNIVFLTVFVVVIAGAFAQQCAQNNKKCAANGECCNACCLGTKCVESTQCMPKCPADSELKCKAGEECYLKTEKQCAKPPCKAVQSCRLIPPCNRLTCRKGMHCVDIGGTPPTAACAPDKTA